MQKQIAIRAACRRTALSLAVGLALSGNVQAQSSDGSIFGQAKAGATITLSNPETGVSRQIKADADGTFSFTKLPPGRYRVVSDGLSREVQVAVGTGSRVVFESVERIEVVGGRASNAIDVSSVESNTVFTQEQLRALPVARDPAAVAQLAPGVVRGDAGLGAGALPSFGGASVAENGYYINGFDVTNIRNFLSYADLPFDAIAQQQIKTGGYGAEYGRSLGGVISLVTKRGTNDWKSGGAVYYEPARFRSKGKNVADQEPTRPNNLFVFQKDDTADLLSYNIYSGGPIIKDKLFVFALVDFKRDIRTDYQQTLATRSKSDKPNTLLKVDFQASDNHLFELTAIGNKQQVDLLDYTSARPFSSTLDGEPRRSVREQGGSVYIGKYTGFLTDNFTVSALLGKVDDMAQKTTGDRLQGADCPVILDVDTSTPGCWTPPFPGPLRRDIAAPDDGDERKAGRLDFEWNIRNHTVRAGYDAQVFKSSEAGTTFTGGVYWRYFVTPNSGIINGVASGLAPGTQYVRRQVNNTTSGAFEVENTALYIEDSWQFNKDLLLYGGLRSESFNNKNASGQSFVKKDNLIAPRLGFAWNVKGDSSLKIYGNAGKYYIPVASNTNIRMTRSELFTREFYPFNGRDPRTQAPLNVGARIGPTLVLGSGALPNPATIADTSLKPMSQDELILGAQANVGSRWTVGVKGVSRKIKDGFDDFCDTHRVLENWARDNGFTRFDSATTADCILMNPGNSVSLQVDVNNDGQLRNVTIPASYFNLAKYKRDYKAIELSFERPWDGKTFFQGSYTWSKSRGTAEGYVSSIIDQDDAGISQDFDFASFTDGADGFLPNDRRHAFRFFGAFGVTPSVRVGFNVNATSGRPLSCIGFVPATVPDFAGSSAYGVASSYYCLDATGRTQLVQRGSVGRTPWTYTLDAQLSYTPKVPHGNLTLKLDVFNLLNSQKAIELNETRDFSRQTSNIFPGQLSQNYGLPTAFQTPRAVRFTAQYEF